MNKKDARAWIDFKATAEDVGNFIRETGAVVGIAKDGQRESKIYVGANFGIPVQTFTVDELGKRGLLRPCEGIQSSNKQFFEAALFSPTVTLTPGKPKPLPSTPYPPPSAPAQSPAGTPSRRSLASAGLAPNPEQRAD